MSISSVKKKINAKTLLGQSSALRENSATLKEGVKKLAAVLVEKRKIKTSTLMATEEKKSQVEVVKEEEEKEKKKGGLGLPGLPPVLPALAALAGLGGLTLLDPKMSAKRLLRALLKRSFGFVKAIGKRLFRVFRAIGRSIRKVFNSIRKFFKKIFNGISDNVKKLKNFFDDKLLRPLREAFESAINSKWFKKLRSFFDDIGTSVKNFIKNSAERFKTFADDIFKKVKTFADDAIEGAIRAFRGILDNIAEKILKPLKSAVLEFVERTKNFLKTGISDIGQGIAERVGKKSFSEAIESLGEAVLKNFDNTVDNIVGRVKAPVDTLKGALKSVGDFGIPTPFGTAKVRNLVPGFGNVENVVDNLSKNLDGIGGSIKKRIRDVPKTVGGLIDDFAAGKTPVNKLINFVGDQFKPEKVLERLTKAGSFVMDTARAGGKMLSDTRDKIAEGVKSLDVVGNSKRILESIGNSIGGFAKQFSNKAKEPLEKEIGNIFKGATSKDQIIEAAIKTGKTARDVKPGFKATNNVIKKVDPVAKNVPGLGAGWRAATTKFDQIFAVLEAAGSYGLALETQRRRDAGEEGISLPVIGEVQGQTLGTSILTAAGGFLGSAIGSQLGTSLGSLIAGGLTVGTAGVGALLIPATVALFGGLGTVLGGILGEDVGKLVSSGLSASNIPDPLLKENDGKTPRPFFQDARSDMTILNMFMNMGGDKEEEPQPKAEGGMIPRPAFAKRRFDLMEDYTEYITDTEVVIITKENVVNNVMQTPMVQQGKGGMIPVPIGSGESVLDNFRSRALSQLAYN